MASKRKKASTIDAIVAAMRKNGPGKQMSVAEIIDVTGRAKGTVYSVIYGEAKKANARVVQVARGVFKLTAAGKRTEA